MSRLRDIRLLRRLLFSAHRAQCTTAGNHFLCMFTLSSSENEYNVTLHKQNLKPCLGGCANYSSFVTRQGMRRSEQQATHTKTWSPRARYESFVARAREISRRSNFLGTAITLYIYGTCPEEPVHAIALRMSGSYARIYSMDYGATSRWVSAPIHTYSVAWL